jgi:hypothetical protein
MMHVATCALPLALALLVSAVPAAAIESLTGTWEGTLKCRVVTGKSVEKTKVDVTLEIVDSGSGGFQAELVSTDLLFVGFVVGESATSSKGVLSSLTCGLSYDDLDGATLQATVKTKAGSEKASLKGHVARLGAVQGIASVCTLKAKRTSAAEPDIIPCAL